MIGTLQALLVAVIAGAAWGPVHHREGKSRRVVGVAGNRRSDADLSVANLLAVFHLVFAWLTYRAYQKLVVTCDLYGKPISWWWYCALLASSPFPTCGVSSSSSAAGSSSRRCWAGNSSRRCRVGQSPAG